MEKANFCLEMYCHGWIEIFLEMLIENVLSDCEDVIENVVLSYFEDVIEDVILRCWFALLIQYVELNFYVAMFEDVGYDVYFRVVWFYYVSHKN